MIIAGTGHRPHKLGGYDLKTRRALGGLAAEWLHRNRPSLVVSGMALGWDLALAAASLMVGIPYIAAVPFEGFESRWPLESQDRFRRILAQAEEVVMVTTDEVYSRHLALRALQKRNEWMVDRVAVEDGQMLALWDGTGGGTWNCLQYADKRGVPVTNLWLDWALPASARDLLD